MNNLADAPNQASNQNQPQGVDVNTFAARYQSKAEVYRFLATEVGAYLPEYAVATIWHLRDIAAGKRRLILAKDIQYLFIPQFEGLKIETMLAFGTQYPEVMRALPIVEHERLKLHRQYIANVTYTLAGDPFYHWVQSIMEARNRAIKHD